MVGCSPVASTRSRLSAECDNVLCQTFEDLEKYMLDGQKLQGPPTAADVVQYLEQKTRDDG